MLRAAVASLAPTLPLLSELGGRFTAAGHEVALVGGPVRDAFLGRVAPDLDLATDARPDDILDVVRGWADTHWDIGREFGTIGLRKGPVVIEVTTYRSDRYDRRSRKPEVAFGSSLVEDLGRRDFTVNAMAMRLPALDFIDAFGGLRDLAARVLRTPATPEESFADDPLRMMRAARFAAQLGFAVAPDVYAAMTAQAPTLAMVSAERVREEFTKLVLADSPREGLRLVVDSGLADVFLPELPALRLEVDEHHRHKDVYEHSLTVLEQAIALEARGDVQRPDLVLRLAALLHDAGKPATRRFEPGGGVSFHHHESVGARLVAKRLKALRYDKDTVTAVARLVELHLRFHGYGQGQWTDSAVRGTSRTRVRCWTSCTCSPDRTARPETAARQPGWPARMTSSRSGSPSSPSRRSWPPCGPSSTATRSPRPWGSGRARYWARPTATCCQCVWTKAPLASQPPRPAFGSGGRRGGATAEPGVLPVPWRYIRAVERCSSGGVNVCSCARLHLHAQCYLRAHLHFHAQLYLRPRARYR